MSSDEFVQNILVTEILTPEGESQFDSNLFSNVSKITQLINWVQRFD